MKITLASTSKYRIQQLKDFGLKFQAVAPHFDESTLKNTKISPHKLAQSLAYHKAKSVQARYSKSVIIGADQLVSYKNKILGKPGSKKRAIEMLNKMNGNSHKLITSICLLYKNKKYTATVTATIQLRKLTHNEIIAYVNRDNPIDCAGSYKFEKSGLSLVQSLSVSDPSSLTGLPLMALHTLLLKISEPIPFMRGRK